MSSHMSSPTLESSRAQIVFVSSWVHQLQHHAWRSANWREFMNGTVQWNIRFLPLSSQTSRTRPFAAKSRLHLLNVANYEWQGQLSVILNNLKRSDQRGKRHGCLSQLFLSSGGNKPTRSLTVRVVSKRIALLAQLITTHQASKTLPFPWIKTELLALCTTGSLIVSWWHLKRTIQWSKSFRLMA